MKTAMQELIELIENGEIRLDLIENHKQIWLEKEKLQIELAHTTGYNDCYKYQKGLTKLVTPRGATEYYNQTYKPETI